MASKYTHTAISFELARCSLSVFCGFAPLDTQIEVVSSAWPVIGLPAMAPGCPLFRVFPPWNIFLDGAGAADTQRIDSSSRLLRLFILALSCDDATQSPKGASSVDSLFSIDPRLAEVSWRSLVVDLQPPVKERAASQAARKLAILCTLLSVPVPPFPLKYWRGNLKDTRGGEPFVLMAHDITLACLAATTTHAAHEQNAFTGAQKPKLVQMGLGA